MTKLFANPYLLLTLTVLFWSGNMVIGRGARADIPPLAFAFWRWARTPRLRASRRTTCGLRALGWCRRWW